MNFDIIIILLSLVLSGFFSGTETAYTVAGRLAMEVFHRHKRRGAAAAEKFYSNPNLFFTITLVGTNLVGVIYSSVAALFLHRLGMPIEGILIISPLILLVFGEILPKSLARENPERFALLASAPLWVSYYLMIPIIFVAMGASRLILKLFKQEAGNEAASITLSELRQTWQELEKSGIVNGEEADMLERMIALRDIKLNEVMTPRTHAEALPISAKVEEAEEIVRSSGFSKIPVYEDDLDHIVGIIFAKDLLKNPGNLYEIKRPIIFIPELVGVRQLFEMLRQQRVSLAVVVDEHGGTAGIITLEDLIELLVGEIEDEHDKKSETIKKVAHRAWLVTGDTKLQRITSLLGAGIPDGDFETVSGLILDKLGNIPKPGELVEINSIIFRIISASSNRINKVLIRLPSSD
ncbi:MAG: hemolysin family protein [Candidatus Electryonea clarkiae]|nr:hemolysin family protein [Candidatus Electryonea clarkiae]MDP8286523.1 hemolysin family protein [Candidatus Electryonea clarkiae]